MAIRKLRYEGDPVLGKVCKEVKEMTPHLQELVQDMLETMLDWQHLRLVFFAVLP